MLQVRTYPLLRLQLPHSMRAKGAVRSDVKGAEPTTHLKSTYRCVVVASKTTRAVVRRREKRNVTLYAPRFRYAHVVDAFLKDRGLRWRWRGHGDVKGDGNWHSKAKSADAPKSAVSKRSRCNTHSYAPCWGMHRVCPLKVEKSTRRLHGCSSSLCTVLMYRRAERGV